MQGVVTAVLHAYMEFAAHRGFKYFHLHVPSPEVAASCSCARRGVSRLAAAVTAGRSQNRGRRISGADVAFGADVGARARRRVRVVSDLCARRVGGRGAVTHQRGLNTAWKRQMRSCRHGELVPVAPQPAIESECQNHGAGHGCAGSWGPAGLGEEGACGGSAWRQATRARRAAAR